MSPNKSHRLAKGKRISSLLPCLASNESDVGINGKDDDVAPKPTCSQSRNNLSETPSSAAGGHGRNAEPSKALHRYSHYTDGSHAECGVSGKRKSHTSPHLSLINILFVDSDRKCAIHTTIEYTHRLVPNMVNIINAPYYWGSLDRYEAEALLDGRPEGAFLLRDSGQILHIETSCP